MNILNVKREFDMSLALIMKPVFYLFVVSATIVIAACTPYLLR